MKSVMNVVMVALVFAAMAFMFCTAAVLVNNFAEWEWVGYNWPVTRFVVGVMFMIGLVAGTNVELDEVS